MIEDKDLFITMPKGEYENIVKRLNEIDEAIREGGATVETIGTHASFIHTEMTPYWLRNVAHPVLRYNLLDKDEVMREFGRNLTEKDRKIFDLENELIGQSVLIADYAMTISQLKTFKGFLSVVFGRKQKTHTK